MASSGCKHRGRPDRIQKSAFKLRDTQAQNGEVWLSLPIAAKKQVVSMAAHVLCLGSAGI